MLNDVTWRKLPIDILTNETMVFIEKQMPKGHETAPYMFYMAALRKADDDGVFDLEDGLIFAQLMRVDDIKLVFKVATLMAQRKMIFHTSTGSNKCLIADWDYPKGTQPRTLAERRAIVQQQIDEAAAHKYCSHFNSGDDDLLESVDFSFSDDDKSPENVTKNVYDDKNTKNVTKNVYDDKNSQNVTKKNDIEREKEREIREREQKHTQERESSREGEKKEASASAKSPDDFATAPAERKKALAQTNKQQKEQKTENNSGSPSSISDSNNEAIKTEEQKDEETTQSDFSGIIAYVEAFFSDKSYGYDIAKGHNSCIKIAERINDMAFKTKNDALKLTASILQVFQKMHESDGAWKDIPLQPVYLLKDAVWAYILGIIGKTYGNSKKKKNAFIEDAKKYEEQAEADKDKIIEQTREEYEYYGIDPTAPNRFVLLMQARQKEKQKEESEGIF